MAKETAEQKLLKLIEQTEAQDAEQQKPEASPAAAAAAVPAASPGPAAPDPGTSSQEALQALDSVKSVGFSPLSLPSIFKNLLGAFKDPATLVQAPRTFGVKDINKLLIILIVLGLIYFVMNFSKGLNESKQKIKIGIPENVSKLADNILPVIKELNGYVEVVKRRNIFHPFELKVEEVLPQEEPEAPKVKIIENKVQSFRLVGVSWLDSVESAHALIEDETTGMTHYLLRGDTLNDVSVDTIFADRVILKYENETTELKF